MTNRVLMLGLDGVDWTSLNEWIAQGRLPVFHRLIDESRRIILRDSNRFLPGAVWVDVATGVSAAVHGYTHEMQLRQGSYEWDAIDASRVAVPPFYKTLNDAGIRCAVVDFPIARPLEGFNGIHVIDWGTEFKLWHFETQPKNFAAELVSTYGRHPLTNYPGTKLDLTNLLALKHQLNKGIEIKRQVTVDLLRRRQHEFIFVNFSELHKAGHFFWRFHDRKHPEYTEAEPQLVDALRESYEQLDRALGSVVGCLSNHDDLVVVADRGMCANYRADHMIDEILFALEFAAPRGGIAENSGHSARARMLTGRRARRVYKFVANHLLPDTVREALLPLHRAAIGELPPCDWKRTRVFRMPAVGDTYLRVNLQGRERQGVVSPGTEYDALLAEIAARFRALMNPETGEPLVADVLFPARHFVGPRAAILPDVALVWNTNAPINGAMSADIGLMKRPPPPDRSGNHRSEGFVLFRGPAFTARPAAREGDAREVASATLQRFSVPIPVHYEVRTTESNAAVFKDTAPARR